MCFSPYLGIGCAQGGGGGAPKGLVHNLLMQLSAYIAQKLKFRKFFFPYLDLSK